MQSLRLHIILIIGFVLCTVIGTVSHEYGHIAVAKYHGYDTELHYASMNWDDESERDSLKYYISQIEVENNEVDGISFSNRIAIIRSQHKQESFWITLGGPIQTLLVSFIGILLLLRGDRKNAWNLASWFHLFAVFFSARFIFNFLLSSIDFVMEGEWPKGGDESKLSFYLGVESWVVPSLLMVVGMVICVQSVFFILPKRFRMTFILSGILGSALGYLIWMQMLGPLFLP